MNDKKRRINIKKTIAFTLRRFKRLIDIAQATLDNGARIRKRPNSLRQYVRDYISKHGIHPEAAAVMPYSQGRGLDIGCGGNKTLSQAIGVDIIPKGQKGKRGNQKGVISEADICASGDQLPFKDNEFDYIIARHNLEHYQDVIKTLLEWRRVLKEGGYLSVVLPDDTKLDTIHLDLDHKHTFTPESFARLIEILGGFEIIKKETCIPHWSFICVLKKSQKND